jgi:hypothetical protein
MRESVLKDHSNAAAFLSSTKVRIFRSDRRNSDRHCGPVLGFNAHLAIQFGIDLAKPPRMIAALACQAGGSAEVCVPKTLSRIDWKGNRLTSAHNDRAVMFYPGRCGLAIQVKEPA